MTENILFSIKSKLRSRINGLTNKQRQWIWFVGLWCAGLASVSLLGFMIRTAMGIQ